MAGRPITRARKKEEARRAKLLFGPRPAGYTAEENRERFDRCRKRAQEASLQPRVCVRCKFAFLSRGGINICHDCSAQIVDAFWAHILSKGPRPKHVKKIWRYIWQMETFNLPKRSITPMIPLPDQHSPFIQAAISGGIDIIRRRLENGQRAILTRLPGLAPYTHLEFRGFKRGRPSRLNQIWGKENGV